MDANQIKGHQHVDDTIGRVADWNDSEGRTQSEVVSAMEKDSELLGILGDSLMYWKINITLGVVVATIIGAIVLSNPEPPSQEEINNYREIISEETVNLANSIEYISDKGDDVAVLQDKLQYLNKILIRLDPIEMRQVAGEINDENIRSNAELKTLLNLTAYRIDPSRENFNDFIWSLQQLSQILTNSSTFGSEQEEIVRNVLSMMDEKHPDDWGKYYPRNIKLTT